MECLKIKTKYELKEFYFTPEIYNNKQKTNRCMRLYLFLSVMKMKMMSKDKILKYHKFHFVEKRKEQI